MEKQYKIVKDPRIARLLLQKNGRQGEDIVKKKYCPYCGARLDAGCSCRKDSIICDIKPNKTNKEATVFCFEVNDDFKTAYAEIERELFPETVAAE